MFRLRPSTCLRRCVCVCNMLLCVYTRRLPATVVETEAGEIALEILPGTLEHGVHVLPPPLPPPPLAGAAAAAGVAERAAEQAVAAEAPLYVWLSGERFGLEMSEEDVRRATRDAASRAALAAARC